jgi:hypothetical protein
MQEQFIQQYHTHNSIDGTPRLDEQISITNTRRFIVYRIVNDSVNTAVANIVGGYFVMPFDGYILDNGIGATVDTAGTTSTMQIDVNLNGSTIMDTKIQIETTETSSRTATTQPVIKPNMRSFVIGDRFSFNVDAINTTPAKGLTIYMNVVKTS